MYLSHFGYSEQPFALLPDPRMLFWSQSHSEAYAMMEYGVISGAPITVITGEVGAGKTTLIRHLLDKLDPTYAVGLISNAQAGRDDMLTWALMALGQDIGEGRSYAQNLNRFQNYLIDQFSKGGRTILIIDEAQNMDPRALEELRMFSNINSDKDALLQLILVGQPELGDMIAKPELRQFAQRIASQYHVPQLSAPETWEYLKHRIISVGGDPVVFSAEVSREIQQATNGVPRLINVLAELALVTAFAQDKHVVSVEMIRSIIPNITRFGAFKAADAVAPEAPSVGDAKNPGKETAEETTTLTLGEHQKR